MKAPTLDHIRRDSVTRTLFAPTTLARAATRLGFVQADPIRAPARAQDLTLRHRVLNYRAGDLERRYARLGLEEDYFVNHGFLPRAIQKLMHPRTPRTVWTSAQWKQANEVLAFIREHGTVHPRAVDAQFAHGKARNWFGGIGNASTQLLDGMHYRGVIRIAGRASGVRLYAACDAYAVVADPHANLAALIDVIVKLYAPLPERSLGELVSHLRGGAPQWMALRNETFKRAKARLPNATVDGTTWYWPENGVRRPSPHDAPDVVRLLAPFDPIVWDRRRFEQLWGWAYRFEAYTPAAKRVRGYYAMPLLWREHVIGWGNVSVRNNTLQTQFGFVKGAAPRDPAFRRALNEEVQRMAAFLGLP